MNHPLICALGVAVAAAPIPAEAFGLRLGMRHGPVYAVPGPGYVTVWDEPDEIVVYRTKRVAEPRRKPATRTAAKGASARKKPVAAAPARATPKAPSGAGHGAVARGPRGGGSGTPFAAAPGGSGGSGGPVFSKAPGGSGGAGGQLYSKHGGFGGSGPTFTRAPGLSGGPTGAYRRLANTGPRPSYGTLRGPATGQFLPRRF